MHPQTTPREPTWDDMNGAPGDIRDALTPPQRETTGAVVIPQATEEVKPRPPQVSLLTARFEDLDSHPAFSRRFNAVLIGYAFARTRDRHSHGRIRGMDG